MGTNVVTDENYELWVLLQQTSDAMSRAREKELRSAGVSMMHAAVLFIVRSVEGPATPTLISRWLFREPHTVSGLLDRMEKEGLIRRVKDLERKNVIRVVITEKGEKAYQQSRETKVIPKILSRLSQKERDKLRAQLEKLRGKALKELGLDTLPFP